MVTLFAGSTSASGRTNGVGTAARFLTPTSLVTLPNGTLIVSDYGNGCLRAVNAVDSMVQTFVGPLASSRPTGLALDPTASTLYMADALNHNILRIISISSSPTWGILAGSAIQSQGFVNGAGTTAKFHSPQGLATDTSGVVYVADFENSVIRSVTPAGLVAVFAGSGAGDSNDGPATIASFWKPSAIAIDEATSNKYVTDTWNYLVRLINPAGIVSTLAGTLKKKGLTDGVGTFAAFFNPRHVTLSPFGLLVSDS